MIYDIGAARKTDALSNAMKNEFEPYRCLLRKAECAPKAASSEDDFSISAGMTLRVLSGEEPQGLVVLNGPHPYPFWGISLVLNCCICTQTNIPALSR